MVTPSAPVAAAPRRRLDRPLVPAAVAAALGVALAGVLLVGAGGDPSELVHAGPPWTDPDDVPDSLEVQPADEAFDGQFYFRLAVAPLSEAEEVAGVELDLPALRAQRIGYPALAWLVAGGSAALVPSALLGINLVGFAALGALGGALARGAGRHAAWGLVVPLYPGFVYSLAFDLAEITAGAFLLAGLLTLRRGHLAWATALLAAAVLTRETTAVVPAGIAAAWVWHRFRPTTSAPARENPSRSREDPRRRPQGEDRPPGWAALGPGVVPLVVAGVWQLVVASQFGELPLASSGDKNVRLPFAGLAAAAEGFWPPTSAAAGFRLLSVALLGGVIALAVARWRSSSAPLGTRLAWVPAVLVLPLLSEFVWAGATSFMRAGTEAWLLSVLIIFGTARAPALPWGLGATGGMWALSAASEVSA